MWWLILFVIFILIGGSGTTAVVSMQLGRKYIGFEISQEYVDLANKRLQETKTLFD